MPPDETFIFYVFNADGMHDGGIRFKASELESVMTGVVRLARAEKREVIITDTGDLTVFHSKDGEILFPKPENIGIGVINPRGVIPD